MLFSAFITAYLGEMALESSAISNRILAFSIALMFFISNSTVLFPCWRILGNELDLACNGGPCRGIIKKNISSFKPRVLAGRTRLNVGVELEM